MLSSALTAGLVLALGQLPWEVGLRSEGRMSAEGDGDLQLSPELTLGYEHRDLFLHLSYGPQLLLREPRSRGLFDHSHAGALSGEWRLGPDTHLRAVQDLSIGSIDLSWLASPPDAVPSSIVRGAQGPSVEMFNESTSLSLAQVLARHLHVGGTARYAIAGGLGSGLADVPRTRTADLGLSGTWIERSDSFTLGSNGSRGWSSTSETTWLLGATAAWRHAFTSASERALRGEQPLRLGEREDPRYETELSGGLATFGGSAQQERGIVPTASLALRRDEPARRAGAFAAHVVFRYAPTRDLATGGLKPRYEASAMGELRLHRQLVAFSGGGAGLTPDPEPPLPKVLAQGALGLRYEPVPDVVISASARVAKVSGVEWGGVVTTTYTRVGRF